MQKMKKLSYISCFLALLSVLVVSVSAHGGRTDSNGGHNSSSGYHYHQGYPAHDHYDIDGDGKKDCPYDFDDKTDHNNHSSSDDKPSKREDITEKKAAGIIVISVLEIIGYSILAIVFLMCTMLLPAIDYGITELIIWIFEKVFKTKVSDEASNRIYFITLISCMIIIVGIISLLVLSDNQVI